MADSSTEPPRVVSLAAHLQAISTIEFPFREALFTTFSFDPTYFESRVLGPVRATGAAVTVLCDGSVFNPDPRAMRSAGRAYHLGVAALDAAFHPKVNVLVGTDRALVSIGSGNLTTGGWLTNEELVTIIDVDRGGAVPRVIADVAGWLRSLLTVGDRLVLGQASRDAISRVADGLEPFIGGGINEDLGPQLVDSSTGPILDQLPEGLADELLLQAPFHDPGGIALDRLLARYRPRRVTIAVQPGLTFVIPPVLSRLAREHGAELRWHEASGPGAGSGVSARYQHGKLLEAVGAGERWALTGSPNLTEAALTRSLADGGNCEVGLVHVIPTSMFRGSGPVLESGSIPERRLEIAPPLTIGGAPLPALVGVTLVDGRIRVELSRPTSVSLEVLVSDYGNDPEARRRLGTIPVGTSVLDLFDEHGTEPGSRVFIGATVDGVLKVGSPLPLLSPGDALRRQSPSSREARNTYESADDVLASQSDLDAYLRLAERVRTEQAPALPVPRAGTARAAREPQKRDEAGHSPLFTGSLHDYLERASRRLGAAVLGGPTGNVPLPGSLVRTLVPQWADIVSEADEDPADARTAVEPEDEPDAVDDPTPVVSLEAAHSSYTAEQRRHWRRSFEQLVKAIEQPSLPEIDRSTYTVLLLLGSRFRVWDDDPPKRPELVARALSSLVENPVRDELLPRIAAVAALCVHSLRTEGLDPRVGTGLMAHEALESSRPLLTYVTEDDLTAVVDAHFGRSERPPQPDEVLDIVRQELDDNPWERYAESIQAAHPSWDVVLVEDGRIRIQASSGAQFTIAAAALSLLPRDLTVAIAVAAGRDRREHLFAQHDWQLAIQERQGARLVWKTYQLSQLVSPSGIAASTDTRVKAQIDPPIAWRTTSETARKILDAAKVAYD